MKVPKVKQPMCSSLRSVPMHTREQCLECEALLLVSALLITFLYLQLLLFEIGKRVVYVSGRLLKLINRRFHACVSRAVLHTSKLVHTAVMLLRPGEHL